MSSVDVSQEKKVSFDDQGKNSSVVIPSFKIPKVKKFPGKVTLKPNKSVQLLSTSTNLPSLSSSRNIGALRESSKFSYNPISKLSSTQSKIRIKDIKPEPIVKRKLGTISSFHCLYSFSLSLCLISTHKISKHSLYSSAP